MRLALRDLPKFGYPIMHVSQVYLRDGFAQRRHEPRRGDRSQLPGL